MMRMTMTIIPSSTVNWNGIKLLAVPLVIYLICTLEYLRGDPHLSFFASSTLSSSSPVSQVPMRWVNWYSVFNLKQ
jgi:hypothetical protein